MIRRANILPIVPSSVIKFGASHYKKVWSDEADLFTYHRHESHNKVPERLH